jgi:predicted small lipoprotein YifL
VDRRFLRHVLVIAAVAAALGVTACGRKGPLEAPSASVQPAPDTTAKTSGDAKPNTSFVLDPLLK